MPSQQQRQQGNKVNSTVIDFSGGMTRLRRQVKNQAYLIQNMRPQADGTLVTRKGQQVVASPGSGSGDVRALYGRYTDQFSLRIYSVVREDGINDKIYDGDVELTGDTGFGVGDFTSITEYKSVIFFSNGSGPVQYHDMGSGSRPWGYQKWGEYEWGSAGRAIITGDPTPPEGAHTCVYKDRFYIGTSDGYVFWSNAGMFTTLPTCDFPALNSQIVGDSANPVTGLIAGQNFVCAFTALSFHVMTGSPDDDGESGDMMWDSYYGVGCVSPYSIIVNGRILIFFGSDKRLYMLLAGVLKDLDELDQVREYFQAIPQSMMKYVACGFLSPSELWIYIPSTSSHKTGVTLVRNLTDRLSNWCVFTNVDGYAMSFVPSIGKLLIGSPSTGKILQQDSGSDDDGSSIPIDFISRQEPLGSYRKKKKYNKVSIQLDVNRGETLSFQYAPDQGSFTSFGSGGGASSFIASVVWGDEVWGASTWGGAGRITVTLVPATPRSLRAYETRLRVYGNVSHGTNIVGYSIDGEVEDRDSMVA